MARNSGTVGASRFREFDLLQVAKRVAWVAIALAIWFAFASIAHQILLWYVAPERGWLLTGEALIGCSMAFVGIAMADKVRRAATLFLGAFGFWLYAATRVDWWPVQPGSYTFLPTVVGAGFLLLLALTVREKRSSLWPGVVAFAAPLSIGILLPSTGPTERLYAIQDVETCQDNPALGFTKGQPYVIDYCLYSQVLGFPESFTVSGNNDHVEATSLRDGFTYLESLHQMSLPFDPARIVLMSVGNESPRPKIGVWESVVPDYAFTGTGENETHRRVFAFWDDTQRIPSLNIEDAQYIVLDAPLGTDDYEMVRASEGVRRQYELLTQPQSP